MKKNNITFNIKGFFPQLRFPSWRLWWVIPLSLFTQVCGLFLFPNQPTSWRPHPLKSILSPEKAFRDSSIVLQGLRLLRPYKEKIIPKVIKKHLKDSSHWSQRTRVHKVKVLTNLTDLISFYDKVTHLSDQWKPVGVICLDFSKAFNIVSYFWAKRPAYS